ncbi:hypothetical protein A5761_09985 [Mycolicibacterium setense]|nr:hypothetical protein A5761_09985 [Mycolicibacterium setense]
MPVDITDPDEVVATIMDPRRSGDLYPFYRQLREIAPVHHCPSDLLGGEWVLTRYNDVKKLLSNKTAVSDPSVVDAAFNHGDGTFTSVMRNVMVFLESESHKRVRALATSSFTPKAIARFRPIAERVANELCDQVEPDGQMDLVSQFNYELPINVIAHVLGIPKEDFGRIKELAWDFARAGERFVNDEAARRGDDAAQGLLAYFGELIEKRRARPGDDLLSSLVAVEDGGDRLSSNELVCNCILLLQAGHETTQDLLGNAMVALVRNPDQQRLLTGRPGATRSAVEEFLRYDGPVQVAHRLLVADMTFEDVVIPAGSMVCAFLGAANRDPGQFPEPDRFDILRDPNPHLAFAFGAYYCLGQMLARTEAVVGIGTLLHRFPGLRPANDTFEWRDTLHLRGPARLDVTW